MVFSRIIVPVDGSAESECALPVAAALARDWSVAVELVRVCTPLPRYGNAPVIDSVFDADMARAIAAALQDTARRFAAEHDIAATAHQLTGPVAAALTAHVDARRDALVVISSHGRGGVSRAWLGSVADALIRRSGSPVLVVPRNAAGGTGARPASRFRRILVPLDGSKFSMQVLEVAGAFASATGTEVHLVRVLEPLPTMEPFPDLAAVIERRRAAVAVAEQHQRAKADLERVGRSLGRPAGTVRTHV
ncbi:MAG: universal stress protein, partial [Gemmatimonadota bacterium]|nr:universal stress protein [Gemmatimonadota bacterium]